MGLIKKLRKVLISMFFLLCFLASCNFCEKENTTSRVMKNAEAIKNRNDSLKWDYEMLKEDVNDINDGFNYPLEIGAFPTPKYDLLGKESFKGLGYYSNKIEINGRNIVTIGFYFNKNSIYKDVLNDIESSVFFRLIILSGNINSNNEDINHIMISSRNNPNYVSQGSYIAKSFKIDYIAFITPDVNSYALINMRLFDLSYGSTVVIAPQKDKTIRSMQLKSNKHITRSNLENYFKKIVKNPELEIFLNSPNNIE